MFDSLIICHDFGINDKIVAFLFFILSYKVSYLAIQFISFISIQYGNN